MTSIDIYSILSSKSLNSHYLNRYIKFIEYCIKNNRLDLENVEKHHICPKAKDLFSEYNSFKYNPWNIAILTRRQHYIAHWMLWKIYKGSQSTAFFRMCKGRIKSSKVYENVRSDQLNMIKIMVKNNEHSFQDVKLRRANSKRMKIRQQYLIDNNLFWAKSDLGKSILREKFKKNNPLFKKENKEKQSNRQISLSKNGMHNFQSDKNINRMKNSNPGQTLKLSLRENVKVLKNLFSSSKSKVKLGKGWHLRSNEWINAKINEIIQLNVISI